MKKVIKRICIALLSVVILIGIGVGVFFMTYQATVKFDFFEKTGAVKKGASGYLYGLAEDGVPSREMAESLNITTLAQKVSGGLQHPTSDIDNVSPMLSGAEYEIVYLQDMYDTWYYDRESIMTARSEGSYDWQEFLNSDYLPKVKAKVAEMKEKTYPAKLVYCLYNECDNGIWFGETQKDDNPDNEYGVWCDYNDVGRESFNQAWKQTYELVKSIDENALIGGPGFCDYNREKLEVFLKFCKENACLPDIMIYHELAEKEAYYFDEHYRDYRALEEELKIEPLEIIITEYGMMSETGYPGKMVQYVAQIENAKVYADAAYWRLANNLCDTCADANTPNAEWWLMRWYADMKGETVKGTNLDVLSSDLENTIKYKYDELSFSGFTGIASVSDEGDEIDVVCGGGDKKSRVWLTNLDKTALYGKEVEIRVEETVYKGILGEACRPVVLKDYTKKLGKSLAVELGKLDAANAYHVVIRESSAKEADERPVRYEFEDGTLLGAAYTYASYCPASGGNEEGHNLVGGMESEGDGVEIEIDIKEEGDYILDFIYGNSNDGPWDENGRQDPDGRVNTQVKLSIDGNEQDIYLPNTIKSEYTSCYPFDSSLAEGKHKIRLTHGYGTYVLDSLVLTKKSANKRIAVLHDGGRTTDTADSYLAVAPKNGYYTVKTDAENGVIDGAKIAFNGGAVFLKKGLNYIDLSQKAEIEIEEYEETEEYYISAEQARLGGGAEMKQVAYGSDGEYMLCVDGISCNGGEAEFNVNAEADGDYRIVLEYSNNDEGGVHDYNVDLIERFVTVEVNGEGLGNFYCRNTYSWQTRNTVCFTARLKKGENKIVLKNDGKTRFNGNDTFAPYIFGIAVFEAYK